MSAESGHSRRFFFKRAAAVPVMAQGLQPKGEENEVEQHPVPADEETLEALKQLARHMNLNSRELDDNPFIAFTKKLRDSYAKGDDSCGLLPFYHMSNVQHAGDTLAKIQKQLPQFEQALTRAREVVGNRKIIVSNGRHYPLFVNRDGLVTDESLAGLKELFGIAKYEAAMQEFADFPDIESRAMREYRAAERMAHTLDTLFPDYNGSFTQAISNYVPGNLRDTPEGGASLFIKMIARDEEAARASERYSIDTLVSRLSGACPDGLSLDEWAERDPGGFSRLAERLGGECKQEAVRREAEWARNEQQEAQMLQQKAVQRQLAQHGEIIGQALGGRAVVQGHSLHFLLPGRMDAAREEALHRALTDILSLRGVKQGAGVECCVVSTIGGEGQERIVPRDIRVPPSGFAWRVDAKSAEALAQALEGKAEFPPVTEKDAVRRYRREGEMRMHLAEDVERLRELVKGSWRERVAAEDVQAKGRA